MRPSEFAFAVTALAASIAENRTDEELAVLSAVFSQLGDTLATMAVKREELKENKENKDR